MRGMTSMFMKDIEKAQLLREAERGNALSNRNRLCSAFDRLQLMGQVDGAWVNREHVIRPKGLFSKHCPYDQSLLIMESVVDIHAEYTAAFEYWHCPQCDYEYGRGIRPECR